MVRPFETTIRAGTPIFTSKGELFGIIVANASANAWLREISELSGISGQFLAANQNGDYIFRNDGGRSSASYDGSARRFERDWPDSQTALQGWHRPPRWTCATATSSSRPIASTTIRKIPTSSSCWPQTSMPMPSSADTWSLTLLGAAIALAMALIGLLAAYFVSRPLKGLMIAARQIAAGKLDVASLQRSGRGTDIGELGEALRIMKDAVETRDASLRKSEAHSQAIVDNTIDGLITIDRRGTILRYNRGCEEIFGYTIDEAMGQNVSILMPEAGWPINTTAISSDTSAPERRASSACGAR